MVRDDWVFVGVKLFGVFTLFWACVEIVTGLEALFRFDLRYCVALALRLVIGWLMARRTLRVCGWLGALEAPK